MIRSLAAGLACFALASCATVPPAPQSWDGFAEQWVQDYFALNPDDAIYQGDHRFDGQLPDWSEAGLAARADFLRRSIAQAQAFTGLAAEDAFERDYLVKVAQGELFFMEDVDFAHNNPSYYTGPLDPNVYLSREYADRPTRMKAMTTFFRNIPDAARQIRANLTAPMPASYVQRGIYAYDGFADFYANDAVEAFADVDDPALQADYRAAAVGAAQAMKDVADWLRTKQPGATADFALGPEKFSKMLWATEAIDYPLNELMKIARADLAKNQAAAREACAKFAPGATIPACFDKMNANKPEGGPVAEATRQIPELTAFVKQHDIVTIPGTETALVRPSPPYNAQNSAYIDPPGPLEKGIPSIYYIAPPNPEWSEEMRAAYIPGKDDLLFTTVHEIMPGHFVQFLHSNRSSSLIGRLFVGYGFAEGWAHYAEQMMWDAGLGDGDPEVHVGLLSNALLRDCRFISAIGLHTQGMSMEESKRLFMDECYQDEGNAIQQAARGTGDPGYLNYTLNKLLITKLRDDWTATRGGRAAWKQFHDEFLSYGGPPVPMVRKVMMGEAEPRTVF